MLTSTSSQSGREIGAVTKEIGAVTKEIGAVNTLPFSMPPLSSQSLVIDWNFLPFEMANLITDHDMVEPKTFEEAGDHPNKEVCENGEKQSIKNLKI